MTGKHFMVRGLWKCLGGPVRRWACSGDNYWALGWINFLVDMVVLEGVTRGLGFRVKKVIMFLLVEDNLPSALQVVEKECKLSRLGFRENVLKGFYKAASRVEICIGIEVHMPQCYDTTSCQPKRDILGGWMLPSVACMV